MSSIRTASVLKLPPLTPPDTLIWPGRPLPHDLNGERQLVGTLLLYPEHLDSVLGIVEADDIHYLPLRRVFEAIVESADAGDIDADGRAVTRRLRGDVDATAELAIIDTFAAAWVQLPIYAERVRDDADRRRVLDIADRAYDPTADLGEVLAEIGRLAARPNGTRRGWLVGSALAPENIRWLWRDRLVADRINVIAGMGDVGKDVLCCTIAAIVTTGREWPDGAPGCEPGNVGIISPEDDPNDTIVPRLIAAGADMARIRIWSGQTRPTPGDLGELSLLIVSPLINLMDGQKDMNREQDARAFLELLQGGLKALGCTVVGTAHLSKKSDLPVVQRILGASGIANFVRSNWSLQRDDEDKTLRLFMRLKANLSPDSVDGLKFTIRHIGPWSQSIVCCWCGTTDKTPDSVMNGRKNEAKTSAGDWLADFLRENGECEFGFIAAAAASNGFGEEAIRKAGHRGDKIIKTRRGFPAVTYWRIDE